MAALVAPRKTPLASTLDVLLADIAIRIQLSPANHQIAVDRYATVNRWIERDGSPLADRVQLFYPQGSMAIGATIASRLRNDEFDIDVIAQLDLPPATSPHEVLNVLERAIRGEPGSRYYDMTRRCTRCIQVQYENDMHLDVTPMIRLPHLHDRCGLISHAQERHAQPSDRSVLANPYGFAEWFKAATPADAEFAKAFAFRESVYEQRVLLKEAQSEPVPAHTAVHEKSMAVIALQLIKRFRNVRYDNRNGRQPPSVLLAKQVADNANRTDTLSEELLHQSRALLLAFELANQQGRCIDVRNPACNEDLFSDRWPASLLEQSVFIGDLRELVSKVERLVAGCDLATMRTILSELFGETPALDAVRILNEQMGNAIASGKSFHTTGTGGFSLERSGVLPAVGSIASSAAHATPKHTNFGSS